MTLSDEGLKASTSASASAAQSQFFVVFLFICVKFYLVFSLFFKEIDARVFRYVNWMKQQGRRVDVD